MKKLSLLFSTLLLLVQNVAKASAGTPFPTAYHDGRISTLVVAVGGTDSYRPFPYYMPTEGETLEIAFDFLEAVPINIHYRLKYFDAHWEATPLNPSEYQRGFAVGELSSSEPSNATKVAYRHYKLRLDGSSNPTPLLSGNWQVIFFEAGHEDTPLLTVSFAILEPVMTVEAEVSPVTQMGAYAKHQEVSVAVHPGRDYAGQPGRGMTVMVGQNGRRDNAVYLSTPSFVGIDNIRYERENGALFEAGNEYASFEILGEHETNMGVMQMEKKGEVTTVTLYPTHNAATTSYIIMDDADGRSVVRAPYNSRNAATEADYYYVRFTFLSQRLPHDLLLSGQAFDLLPYAERKLKYDEQEEAYRRTILLKAGYYSYLYVTAMENSFSSRETVGTHYQATNSYSVLTYLRHEGERHDRLIAATEICDR